MSTPFYTKIEIYNNNHNELEKFEQQIHKWTEQNFHDNDFGLKWLGNIVGNSGIGSTKREDPNYFDCRGNLLDCTLHDNKISIETETLNCVILKMWLKLLEIYLPDAILIYQTDDSSDSYWTNDSKLAGKYIIDPYDIEDIEYSSEATEEELISALQKLLETDESNIDNLKEMLADSEYDCEIGIYQWEFVHANKWN